MSKTVKKIWNWVSGVLVGIVVLLAIALVGVRLIGLAPYVVLSGSMEPTLSVDDLVIVRAAEDYAVGDVVVYQSGHSLVIHRIVAMSSEGFDSMPWNNFIVLVLTMAGLSYSKSYKHVFICSVLMTMAATLLVIVGISLFA